MLKLNKKELYSLVENVTKKVLKEIEAYHYSNADFNEFDIAYVNSGNKMQAFGYGIYLSLTDDGAKPYGKNKYIVKIPNNDRKYLNGNKIYNKNFLNKIKNALFKHIIKINDSYKGVENELYDELGYAFDNEMNGLDISGTIETYLGSDKETSEFLYSLGFIGIKFTDEKTNITNVVMYNPKDIKIINKNIN